MGSFYFDMDENLHVTVDGSDDSNVIVNIADMGGGSFKEIFIANTDGTSRVSVNLITDTGDVQGIESTGNGEVWLGFVSIGGDLGLDSADEVSVERIDDVTVMGRLDAKLTILGSTVASTSSVNILKARGGIYNDILVNGIVNDIVADGAGASDFQPIGTSGTPVQIAITNGRIANKIQAGEFYADITVTAGNGNDGRVNLIQSLADGTNMEGDFVGSLQAESLGRLEVMRNLEADVTLADSLEDSIAVWGLFHADNTITLPAQGLPTGTGIYFNQSYTDYSDSDNGWFGEVKVGSYTIDPGAASGSDDVEYTFTPTQLGGGTVGAPREDLNAGFAMHDEGNFPTNGATYEESRIKIGCTEINCCENIPLEEVVLRFYGGVRLESSPQAPYIILERNTVPVSKFALGSTAGYELVEGPGANELTLRMRDISGNIVPFDPALWEVFPNDVDEDAGKIESVRHPAFASGGVDGIEVRDFYYVFNVTNSECESFGALLAERFDLNGDDMIDINDVGAWMEDPTDITGDGLANDDDLGRLLKASRR